ncbi:MAG: NADH-quinone oxidoreductase subunit NuoF [Oscillospiraceae bacterium]|nr:NADH-quinone oxidoreductase subunit NuoF [Oscillospiraceae bacterium]
MIHSHVLACQGNSCTACGSREVILAIEDSIKRNGLENEIKVITTGCHGLCSVGPILAIYPGAVTYAKVTPEDADEIVREHLINGKPVKKLVFDENAEGGSITSVNDTPFYKNQQRIALKNCGIIDPENIEEYIASDGYQALGKALVEMTPENVIKCVKDSGLRGRGGAGFSTGLKWELAKKPVSETKYVCCNADEGDPGAFMDRSVLESDPHSVLEAMAIAGYAIGASEGYIYIRAEYPVAVKRLEIAINQAKELGLLGNDILGTGFDFEITIRLGAGAFVCGEETALLTSIEGNRGEPKPRPPYPAVKGLFGKPTILNNVETYANIPQIILNGAEWFSGIGTKKSKGTKVFALGGKIENTGLVEIPIGTTLRKVVEEIGGGVPNGKNFKAAQTGGPSGGCIPASLIDTPIDYENLTAIGSMMGSGGLIIMDEETCMVDIARYFLDFTVDESCGKCVPCRIGTKRIHEILEKITSGNGEMKDLEKLEDLCQHVKTSSLCALGQSAPNPILTTIRYFRDEYEEHIKDKKCVAGVCKQLLQYIIIEAKCTGCTACVKVCPTGAISGELKKPHSIDRSKCIKCGACVKRCRFGAIIKR